MVFIGLNVFAQVRTITGTVMNADDGSTLPGVSVVVKGTAVGTITDPGGKYSLEVPAEGKSLVFSFVGMTTLEVQIGASKVIDVSLETDALRVDEVVFTAFGISKERKSLGYAVQDIEGEEFTKARESNIVNSLSGRVSGINVTNSSGAVGSSSRITLRGASSITGNNEPLFVVDGVPIDNTNYGTADYSGGFDMPNGIADINPDDIESVTILKGPNAAALYGLRASNGVIVIKTKTGKKGSKKDGIGVSFNSSTTFESPLVLPSLQNSYGQGPNKDYFEWVDGTTGDGGVDESWGPPLDVGLSFVQWDNYKYDGGASPWISHTDNIKNFYNTGVTLNNNLSLSGGGDKSTYRLSMGMTDQTGIVPNTEIRKYNISGNSTFDITDKFKAGFSLNYIKQLSDNLPTAGYTNENPVQQMIWGGRNVDFEALRDYENLPMSPVGTPAEGTPLNWNTQFQNNPYWVLDNNLNILNKDRIIGSLNLSYQITDNLSVRGRTGVDSWSSLIQEQKAVGSNEFKEGFYSETDRRYNEMNSELLFAYNRKISDDFGFNFNFGGNQMSRSYTRLIGEAPQLELPNVYSLSNVKSGVSTVLTSFTEESKINSLYGFGQLSFRNALFLDFTGRNDWASVLPIENNSFFYPSVTVSAVLNELLSIESSTLTFLKVRGGWSKVGGIGALDPYQLQQAYKFRDDPWGAILLAHNPDLLNNPNLISETTTGIEFGLDARFFHNRVRFDATYFDQVSTDLIVDVEVSAASGYIFAWDNVGEMSNKGIELMLGLTPLKTKDWTVDFDVNYFKNNNEVVSLGGLEALTLGGQWNVDLQAREGQPYGTLFGPAYERDPNGNIVHEKGVPVVATDYQVLGNIQPDWRGGVTMNVQYRNVQFGATVDGKFGGDVYTMTTTWGRYAGILEETLEGRELGIVGEGVKNIGSDENPEYVTNDVVVSAEQYNKSAYDNSVAEGSVFDASYVKLRQVVFTYTLPRKWLEKTSIYNASVSFVGRNLAILHKNAPHIDPETSFSSENDQQGMEFGQLPTVRSLGFNINLTF